MRYALISDIHANLPALQSVLRAREIAEAVGGRTRIDGVSEALRVRASVGVALWPAHADGFDGLLEAADDAMYRAKREGAVSAIARATQHDSGLLTVLTARPDDV